MKKLLGTIIGLSLAFLFSVQAYAMQEQRREPAPVSQPRIVQTIYYNPIPVQWYTHVTQRVSVPYSQNSQQGTSNTGVAQQLKQFSDQTQKQMADFSKL